jgi:hypothetical protein
LRFLNTLEETGAYAREAQRRDQLATCAETKIREKPKVGSVVAEREEKRDDEYSQRGSFQFRRYVDRNLVDEVAEETTNSLTDIVGVDIECQGKNEIPIKQSVRSRPRVPRNERSKTYIPRHMPPSR